nr:hypothetical protein [uncultured Desulfobacter sp.]
MMITMRHRRQGSASNEAEALQTDIMRFFAIICLCLMIVFALVQSLPVSQTENKPQMLDKELLEQQINNLEQKARELNQFLDALEAQVADKKKALEANTKQLKESLERIEALDKASNEKAQALKEKKQMFSAVNALIHEAKAQEEKFRTLASKAREELVQKQADLDRTSQMVARGRDRLDAMEKTLAETQHAVADMEKQRQAPAPTKAQAKPAEVTTPATPESKPFPVQPEKEGFSLGFKSNQDLIHLLKQGKKVKFYMLSGNRAWMLSVSSLGSVSFVSANTPEKIYKMVRSTVPDQIIQAGRTVVAAFKKSEVTYGVTLSPDITAQFDRLMQDRKGGDLVISSRGKVSLE